jgi:enoyl-CoA hydratase
MDQSLAGPEMVEGFRAFKEHRSPDWVPDDLKIDGRS